MIVYTPFNGSLTYKLTVSLSTLPVFFFPAEVGIRSGHVTGVQTCALPILFELAAPGSLVPGVLGAICLLLALFAFQALPISYAGLGLIALGLAFIIAEAFVPSFGILGIGGVISFVIGSIMLFDTDTEVFRVSMELIAGLAIVSALLLLGLVTLLLRSRRQPKASGADLMVGQIGEAIYAFDGQGQVRIEGEIWAAESDAPLNENEAVRVLARDGLRLKVTPVKSSLLNDFKDEPHD